MRFTEATLSDVGTPAELNKRLIEDEDHPNPMNVEQLADRMSGWLQDEYSCYLPVAEGTTIAYCVFRDDGEFYYMRQLFVERTHRRQGIATKLLDWMYAHVWADKKVRLDVLAHNKEAISFYENYGFSTSCFRMEK
jgi:ribosomal protein S18 acetylase RimI-like enzyme